MKKRTKFIKSQGSGLFGLKIEKFPKLLILLQHLGTFSDFGFGDAVGWRDLEVSVTELTHHLVGFGLLN